MEGRKVFMAFDQYRESKGKFDDEQFLEEYAEFFASLTLNERRLRYYMILLAQWQYLHFGQQNSRFWSMKRREFDIKLQEPSVHKNDLVVRPLRSLPEHLDEKGEVNLYTHAEGYINETICYYFLRIEFSSLKRDDKIQKALGDMVTILNHSCLPVFIGGDLSTEEIKDPRILDIMAAQIPELQETA